MSPAWPSRAAVQVDAVVDMMVGLACDEPVSLHLAVRDEYQPVFVVPAGIAGAGGDGEPEVRPVPADLSGLEHEETSRATLPRIAAPPGNRSTISDPLSADNQRPRPWARFRPPLLTLS